jgi:hypothetical protein
MGNLENALYLVMKSIPGRLHYLTHTGNCKKKLIFFLAKTLFEEAENGLHLLL